MVSVTLSILRSTITLAFLCLHAQHAIADEPALTLRREANWLIIDGSHLPGEAIRINYLEAYCRAGSTEADWGKHTVIGHRSELVFRSADGRRIEIRDELQDGVIVKHRIEARQDEVLFQLELHNTGKKASEAHWAQPCVRLGTFTGYSDKLEGNLEDYLPKCFVFLDGKLSRMPTRDWATKARYVPGQVWKPAHVPATDVNPRPLSRLTTSNGLIGCFSADEKLIFAMASEPYQELFQGVARCLHADFRIGGLKPGERKTVRSKIYLVKNDVPALLKRYEADFPEQVGR